MTQFQILMIRLIIGIVFAVVLSRVFHPEFHIAGVAAFAALLISLAYGLEWRRRRRRAAGKSFAPAEEEGGDHR